MAIIYERDDAPYRLDTPYTMELGDTFPGTLTNNDLDLVWTELTAGTTYEFSLTGRGQGDRLDDPSLNLWDSSSNPVASNDNRAPDDLSSLIKFTPETSGSYYIGIWSTNSESGDYELQVSEGEPDPDPDFAAYDEIAHQLTDGFWEWQNFVRHSFYVEPGGTLDVDVTALTAEGQQLARWALDAWTNVTGIDFRFVNSPDAHITFYDDEEGGFGGADRVVSGGRILSSHVNISADWLAEYGTSMDSYSFYTYIHEIGHALGLGHPGNYPVDDGTPTATYGIDNLFANDSWQATNMSYFDQRENTHIDADYALPVTPMIADIIAIQNLYGVPADINSGNTVYGSNSNVGGYLGELFALITGEQRDSDVYGGGPIAGTIYDTGGIDTLDLRTDTRDQRVDLRAEGISDIFGLTGNLIIARDTVIENFIAGSGDDRVTGNSAANRLEGRAGNDNLDGGAGHDSLQGGEGDDTLTGRGGNDRLWGGGGYDSLEGGSGADELRGGAGDDKLNGGTDNDSLYGEEGNDRLIGGLGHDTLFGSTGDDKLIGAAGNDALEGEEGNDTLFGNAGGDKLRGGRDNDTLNGGEDSDEVWGEEGNDRVIGGRGDDRLFGSTGDDKLIGAAGNDTLEGEEDNDTLFGNAGNDRLFGNAGDDRLWGAGGDDTLEGGIGNDRLGGGAGADLFVLDVAHGADTITDFANGDDRIDLSGFNLSNGYRDVAATAVAGGVRIDLSAHGGGTILLRNAALGDLDASDFLF